MQDDVELLEKYKELVPLILLALAQIEKDKAQAQPQPQPQPVEAINSTPEPEPEPEPTPTPETVLVPEPEPEPVTPPLSKEMVMAAIKEYLAIAAPPIVQTSSNIIPKTIKDVDNLLKTHPLAIK